MILLCEAGAPVERMAGIIREADKEGIAQDLTDSHVLLSVDGFRAWAVVRELFGADVLGLPYLCVELYPFAQEQVYLFRAGKTSEFGYLILAPGSVAEALFDTLQSAVTKREGCLCGVDVHNDLRLEGRFFNIQSEGFRVRDPLVLGLQWMIDFDKERFNGRDGCYCQKLQGTRKSKAEDDKVF